MGSTPRKGSTEDGQPEKSNRVFVGCLSKFTKDEGLYTLFGGLPGFVSSQVVFDKESGLCKGYGFLVFTTTALAEECINLMDGVELDGRFINVKWCLSKAFPPDANPAARTERPHFQPREHANPGWEGKVRTRDAEPTYAVRITGLPSDAVWTELKDFLRSVGDIQFVGINRDGSAIARFCSNRDKFAAIGSLNGSQYRGHRISVVEENEDAGRLPAKRPFRDEYAAPHAHEPPRSRRPPAPYPTYGREDMYAAGREGYAPNAQFRRQHPAASGAGRLPMHPHGGYADEVYPYEYELYEYSDEGYFDGVYEGGEEVYEEYGGPVYRGEDRLRQGAPMRSMPAYVRYSR